MHHVVHHTEFVLPTPKLATYFRVRIYIVRMLWFGGYRVDIEREERWNEEEVKERLDSVDGGVCFDCLFKGE